MKNWEIKIRKKSNFNDASVHGSKMSENVTRPYCVIYLLLFPVWQHWRWAMRATIICLPLSNWLTCGFLIQRESMIKLHRSVKVNNMDTHVAVESNKKKCEQLKIAIYMPRNRICGRHNHPHKSIVCPTCIASRKQKKNGTTICLVGLIEARATASCHMSPSPACMTALDCTHFYIICIITMNELIRY